MTDQVEKKETGGKPVVPQQSDPFTTFRNEMNHLIDSFSGGGFPDFRDIFSGRSEHLSFPDIDVRETEAELFVEAELPGIEEKDISVTLRNGMLTIKGEKKFEHDEEKENFHRIERRYGSFQRSVNVPDTVDEEKVDAQFENGILTVKLPKRPEAVKAERKIAIRSG